MSDVEMALATNGHLDKASCIVSDRVIVMIGDHDYQVLTQSGSARGGNVSTLIVRGGRSNPRDFLKNVLLGVAVLALCAVIVLGHHHSCARAVEDRHVTESLTQNEVHGATVSSDPGRSQRLARHSRSTNIRPTPFAHLKVNSSVSQAYRSVNAIGYHHRYLLWEDTNNVGELANVNKVYPPLRPENKIQGLAIVFPGLYLVYSQVAIHGRQTSSSANHYDCAHKTYQKRNGNTIVLMQSLLTQNNGGGNFRPRHSRGQRIQPSDTALHMGIFYLVPGDEIMVGYENYCHHVVYRNDENNAYFGLIRLGVIN